MARGWIEPSRRGKATAATAKTPAYASIPSSQLATQMLRRLSGDAIRILLIAHANWTPTKALPMPVTSIAKMLCLSKLNVSAALRSLQPVILTVRNPPIRPDHMGAKRGSAAVYEVTGRRPGTAHRVFEPGDRRLTGSFRILSDDLRQLASILTDNEARILVCIVLPCHRDKHGAPQQPQQVDLSGRGVAKAMPDMPARSARRAIDGLTTKGLVRPVTGASGCRPATYEPIGLAASTVRRGRRSSNATNMVLQGGSGMAHKPAKSTQKPGHSGVQNGVACHHRPITSDLCATTDPSTTNGSATTASLNAALLLLAEGPVMRDTG
jgi:hypothetical protein